MTATPSASRAGNTIRVAAAAKLNLYLHVVGRRSDGYHLLDSLIAFASVHDTVEVSPAHALELRLEGPFGQALTAEADNLVLRAARRLSERAGVAPNVKIKLIKRLPVASGIGGGSADAAATMRALCLLWDVKIADAELTTLALALGADVPMCLAGQAAFAGGVGEVLSPALRLPDAGILLVNPGIAVPTPAVFAARRGEFSAPGRFSDSPSDASLLAALLATRRNDLEVPARAICPAIGDALNALASIRDCRLARMSGSGATCFGLFDDEKAAHAAHAAAARPGWWTAAGRLVSDTRILDAEEAALAG